MYNIQCELNKLRKSLKTLQSTVKYYEAKEKELSKLLTYSDEHERNIKFLQLMRNKCRNITEKTAECFTMKQISSMMAQKEFDRDSFYLDITA